MHELNLHLEVRMINRWTNAAILFGLRLVSHTDVFGTLGARCWGVGTQLVLRDLATTYTCVWYRVIWVLALLWDENFTRNRTISGAVARHTKMGTWGNYVRR
jgi:hypothetical protein